MKICYSRRLTSNLEKLRFSFLSGKCSVSDLERTWLALPNRAGGMGSIDSIQFSKSQYHASLAITRPFVVCLLSSEKEFSYEAIAELMDILAKVKTQRYDHKARMRFVRDGLDDHVSMVHLFGCLL